MRHLFVLITALFLVSILNAQVSVNLNYNLDKQPAWGPTGYDYVEYYYLPDIEAYYYVPQQRYYYYDSGRWIYSSNLPSRFKSYDIYNSYKVVVNEPKPWRNHKAYREQYIIYKDRHDQHPIRDSRDSKYFVNKNHPEHSNWVKQQKHDNGNRNDGNKNNNRDKRGKNKK
ncbi:MAG: hypothetical protein RDU14_17690 [Melioribacteraceae bacterium]|jgi:hypothetical protein|nr:hypothetical protein [Melioribacteraceae bacterium]